MTTDESDGNGIIKSCNSGQSKSPMTLIDVEDLVGKSFDIKEDDNSISNITIIEAIKNHMKDVEENSVYTKFKIKHNKDKFEEFLTYNELMDFLNNFEDGPIMCRLDQIVSHQGPLDGNHPTYIGSKYNVMVQWENGEITEEPITIIAADASVAWAIYTKKFNMLGKEGWKKFKRQAKEQGRIFKEANKVKICTHQHRPKSKYGVQIPKDYNDALRLDAKN